jgi:hypothetical protein
LTYLWNWVHCAANDKFELKLTNAALRADDRFGRNADFCCTCKLDGAIRRKRTLVATY